MIYDKEMVSNYYKMMEDYDNDYVLNIFNKTIPEHSSVLELGFGTGKDYLQLKSRYDITGSDNSLEFIERFQEQYDDDILQLDAVAIETANKYDCIYSSKVLNSLGEQDIIRSLKRQYQILSDGGYIFHTLWYGNKEEDDSYIDKQTLIEVLKLDYEFIDFTYYKESDFIDAEYDSIIIIGRK